MHRGTIETPQFVSCFIRFGHCRHSFPLSRLQLRLSHAEIEGMPESNEIEIRLDRLRRSYFEGQRERVVLDDVCIEFNRGESVAIKGRSGSGKSTLLNLIGAIDVPDAGQVVISGVDISKLSERDRTLFRRQHIGFVYQAFNLIPTLSVADNIRFVLELNQIKGQAASRQIDKLLTAVGLGDRADSYPDVLSGGEQQRVAIARALCHAPSILIADEPTGNLDDATADTVLTLLSELVHKSRSTLLIATHSARVAASCDRAFELHNGKLEELRSGGGVA
jgi:putative ABC transport system ATP-binding protein